MGDRPVNELPDWLRRRARLSPDHPAIIANGVAWSFRELDDRADATAANLEALGLERGDRVALLARNSAAFAQVVFGAARAGVTLVPLNLRLSDAEIAWQLADSGAMLLVTDREEQTVTAADRAPVRSVPLANLTARPDNPPSRNTDAGFDAGAAQLIMYTSGTSGRPKGAVLTFGNLFWSAFGSMATLGVHEDDRWLACLPLFHIGGLSILTRSVINGTTAVIHENFDAARANRAIDEEGVTLISVVSTMLLRMLEQRNYRPFPESLRCVLLGGGPVPAELLDVGTRLHIPIAQTYGLTETASQATTLRLAEAAARPGSAGKPLLPAEVRIGREDGTLCEPQEEGEILVRGATVSPGYWRNPEATAVAMRGGWLHTGDMGYMDEDGYLYVIDRRDDLIVSGGENVYPAEVESVLSTHPDVAEAGVFGLADAHWGQLVAAAVVPRAAATLDIDSLLGHCRTRLAGYKAPRRVFVASELPRTASGKLLRRELRRIYEGTGHP